jgi:hypothetical protein
VSQRVSALGVANARPIGAGVAADARCFSLCTPTCTELVLNPSPVDVKECCRERSSFWTLHGGGELRGEPPLLRDMRPAPPTPPRRAHPLGAPGGGATLTHPPQSVNQCTRETRQTEPRTSTDASMSSWSFGAKWGIDACLRSPFLCSGIVLGPQKCYKSADCARYICQTNISRFFFFLFRPRGTLHRLTHPDPPRHTCGGTNFFAPQQPQRTDN